MRRKQEGIYWATFLIIASLLTTGVVAYAQLAVADIEEQEYRTKLLSPQSRSGSKLLQDKSLEL